MDPIPLLLAVTILPFSFNALIALIIIILLLSVSAFVSGSEVAFFSLSPSDMDVIEESGDKKDKNIIELLKQPELLLATILIANNFVNIAIIILSSLFISYTIDFSESPILGFIFQTVIITFVLLLLGEIMPKIYSQQNPLRMARFGSGALKVFEFCFSPFSRILVSSTAIMNKRMSRHNHNNISMNEIQQALEITQNNIEEDTDILKGIANFGNLTAASIMTSRMDMISLDINDSFDKVIDCVQTHEYSRMPVLQNNYDNIRGVLYAKDLIPHLGKGSNFKWQTLIRQPYFVPETIKIDDLLQEMQKNKIHIAIVADEFGGTSGIVTMEDILEEVVGEISDEHDDDEETLYTANPDGTYTFEGKIALADFVKIDCIDSDDFQEQIDEVDTLAGLILEIKQDFPAIGEKIRYKQYIFTIEEVDERRILKIRMQIEKAVADI